jgi:hypothetical protein
LDADATFVIESFYSDGRRQPNLKQLVLSGRRQRICIGQDWLDVWEIQAAQQATGNCR